MSVSFLQGSSSTNACWTMIGVGIRMAQDVGAHRKASYTDTLTLEGELWKRTVWYAKNRKQLRSVVDGILQVFGVF